MTTSQTELTSEARNWATLSHLSAFSTFVGIPPVVGPLAMWLLRRDGGYAEHHSKEALNFNISFIIYGILAGLSILVLVGFILLPAVFITWFVLTIKAAVASSNGEWYRYPMTMRFVS